ncbi:class I SAM-dependent methyltransferase [Methylocystis sp. JAN1]|uniref:class I SAM-dependent methyltransferase n=1 Tax=Methylocystis sp. JAN1 TaxID=3397211 RepID=UPI003FA1F42F
MNFQFQTLADMINRQLSVFPRHKLFLNRRFDSAGAEDLIFCEEISKMILQISGDELPTILDDYRWLCGVFMEEELFFRREGRYRHRTFEEAQRTVYSDRVFHSRYLNGHLMTHLWWANHTDTLRYFRNVFLPANKQQFRHLEIGPGHGLFLYFAAAAPNAATIAGWDVSPSSIAATRHALFAMGAPRPVDLSLVNIFDASEARAGDQQFDSLTCSEVLEHLENPPEAMAAIVDLMAPGGRAFICVPVNSPAPDHISLYRSPEEVISLVRDAGLAVEDTLFALPTGVTLERARKDALTINTVVIARKPE